MKERIFILTGSFAYGGTEKFLFDLIQNLDKNRFDVIVGCYASGGPFLPNLHRPPIELGFTNVIKVLRVPLVLYRLVRYLRSQQFDILFATHFQTNAYLAVASIFAKPTGLVLGYRGTGRLNLARRCLNQLMLRMADRIIVNSMAESKTLVDEACSRRDKIRVVYNAAEFSLIEENEDNSTRFQSKLPVNWSAYKIIGSVGRLHKIKGHAYLIQAFAALHKDYSDTLLVIVGDGPERGNLKTLAFNLGIDSRVILAGFCKTTRAILESMRIFVLPSLNESFPNALLEAMAAGLPCVASSVGGVPEVVEDGIDGLLVPPADSSSLEKALRQLLEISCPALDEMRRQASRKGSFFTKERMVREVEAVFREVLNRGAPR